MHILYQIVGFIHYKDGINKRRWIKRSFIVEIVLDLASALKSHSQTKNTLNSVPLLTLLSATWSWSNKFFTSLLKHYPSKILLKHYQSKIVKKTLTLLCCKSDIPWPLTMYPVFFKKQNLVGLVIERVIHLTILSYSHSALNN